MFLFKIIHEQPKKDVMVNQCFSVVYWHITHDEQSEK